MSDVLDRNRSVSEVRGHWFPLAGPLSRVIKRGSLTIIDAYGTAHHFGREGTEPAAAIRLHDRTLSFTLLRNTGLRFGEAYMDGAITIERGTLRDLLEIVAINSASEGLVPWERSDQWLLGLRRRLQQHNPISRSRANVAHHYDLSDGLYDLFEWHRRFAANRARIAELYDERFCRMWELYLLGCKMQFRHLSMMVFQIQLAREPDAVPLTRDYLYE
jgi:hypothetical protein